MKRISTITAAERDIDKERGIDAPVSSYFGIETFNDAVMKDKLPKDVYKKLKKNIEENSPLDIDTANSVAHAMKVWAIENGATHYAHWFQPMTGATAEKHDAFIEPDGQGNVVERFTGKQLVQGEPDASSFPSGGIRATFEARGYTAWDMSSPAFLRKNGMGTTLCIPTAFISYTGEALDKKTPLLRSIRAVNSSSLKLLKLLGNNKSTKVVANLGPEQEYFLIDADYFYKRQDLVLSGRTLVGAPPAKGQELDDQYFGAIKERVQSYMHDVEEQLFKLGIPAMTRHNEVAPSQFEIAPMYEEANIAVDHNQLIMDVLKTVARQHGLACMMHEKPFARINGSGKHLNWSLSTDDGINLLNPGNTPEDNVSFLAFLLATIKAVYKHADILRATVASAGNDHRLGANEAPPAIISVFLGEQLSNILNDIAAGKAASASIEEIIDLGLSSLAVVSKDTTDRNRTSPFAFTGNKFEFRAPGSNQSISFPATVLNTIVAESIDEIIVKLEAKGSGDIKKAVLEIIKEEMAVISPVLFMGDNYSEEWHKEAEKRGLPNLRTTPEALTALNTEKAKKVFSDYKVLSPIELKSRYNVKLEKYATDIEIEAKALENIAMTQIIPAAIAYQKELASSIKNTMDILGDATELGAQKDQLKKVAGLISTISTKIADLKAKYESVDGEEQECADFMCVTVKTTIEDIREDIDVLEGLVDDSKWQLPKFWEMLFIS